MKIKYASTFLSLLMACLVLSLSGPASADANSDWNSKCMGCHNTPLSSFSPSGYTHAELVTKIKDSMPKNNATACGLTCATAIADVVLPVEAKTTSSTNLIGPSPLTSSFAHASSTCNGVCTYHWDFGDGTSFTTADHLSGPSHTYTSLGSYRVTLTVTDSSGQSDHRSVYVSVTSPESLTSYVNSCKSQLNFTDNDIPDDLNCANGQLFGDGMGNPVNDFMDYRRVTDKVDLVFACRWLQNGTGVNETTEPPFIMAASVELFIHNRENGKTCFFRAKDQSIPLPNNGGTRGGVPVNIVSPTVAAKAAPGSPDANFWDQPQDLATDLPCVDCHVAGPVISTPRIAPYLARFGLLNNGHDTFGRTLTGTTSSTGKYFSVGKTFGFFNVLAASNNYQSTCAAGCHSIGYYSTADSPVASAPPGTATFGLLLPSLYFNVIGPGHLTDVDDNEVSVESLGIMPANFPANGIGAGGSDYSWINRDTPYGSGKGGDSETFAEAKQDYSTLLSYCDAPIEMQAHAVGSDYDFSTAPLPDKLAVFNVRDGLVCNPGDQDDGQCNNYKVRYQCTAADSSTSWGGWHDWDTNPGDGDHEERYHHGNICPSGSKVTGIEAEAMVNGLNYIGYGPQDRLAQFSPYGLVCNNSDQPNGQCSNYVVRFLSCMDAPTAYTAHLVSAWSGKLLTAHGTQNNGDIKVQPQNSSWNTQDWIIEPVTDTEYVRLKNVATGRYLNSQDYADYTPIVIYDLVPEWGSEEWIIEAVSGSNEVRLKNVWTGRYLTAHDNSNYSDIFSQSLNASWPSQKWRIQ